MNADALNADSIITRYHQLRQELREHPERASDLAPQMQQLRGRWRPYNGAGDLAGLATGETEAD